MELYLDDQPLEITESDETILRTVVERVSSLLAEQNRVICEVLVDGRFEGDWETDAFAQRPVSEVGTVRLKSEEPRRLAIKTLYDIVAYMPKIKDAFIKVSADLQSRQEDEALQLLSQASQTWGDLNQGYMRAAQVVGVDLDEIPVKGSEEVTGGATNAAALQQRVLEHLEQAAEMLEGRRFLELSDVLEYELAPLIVVLEETMYLVIREAERKPN